MEENKEIDISPLARSLAKKFPHFAHILARIKLILSTKDRTAWIESDTDTIVKINPDFLREIQDSIEDFIFVVMHEVLHKILRHISRFQNFDAPEDIINFVTDARVNYILTRFFQMNTKKIPMIRPEHLWEMLGINEKEYLELTDEEIIKTLHAKRQRGEVLYIPLPHDSHPWISRTSQTQQITRQTTQQHNLQSTSGSKSKSESKSQGSTSSGTKEQKDSDSSRIASDTFNISDILHAKEFLEKMRGKGTGKEFFEVIRQLYNPKINWKRILRKIFSRYYKGKKEDTYIPPNKKKSLITKKTGIIFPSEKPKKAIYPLFLIVDSSSSISDTEFNVFISECLSLINTYKDHISKIYYIVFTYGISHFKVFDTPNIAITYLSKFERTQGGTSIDETFKQIFEIAGKNKKIQKDIKNSVWIILSDGFFGNWGYDVIKSQRVKPKKVFFFITTMKWRECPKYPLFRAYFLSVKG